jgi:hypothetical protein
MKENKYRPSSIAGEIQQVWMRIYDLARQRGLTEEEAKEFANAKTSSQATEKWLETYAVARWEGLSEEMAMAFSNAEVQEMKTQDVEDRQGHHKGQPTARTDAAIRGPVARHETPSSVSSANASAKSLLDAFRGFAIRLHLVRSMRS